MSPLERLYAKLPLPMQNSAVSLFGLYWYWLRFGGSYKALKNGYALRDRFHKDQWEDYQRAKLRELLRICVNDVPYYSRVWTEEHKAAALAGDLAGLPLLEKEPLRLNSSDFVRRDIKPLFTITNFTSGTTGTPISAISTPSEIRDAMAIREVRSAGWAGVSFRLPRATFSGRMAEPDPESKGPYYRYNAVERQVYFSPFHLRLANAHFYVDALKKHKIQWMTGYAVSYFLLAKFILEEGLEVPPIKAVITTSEKLTPEMRAIMEEAYRCPIFEEYSTVENVLFVSECEKGCLHVSPDAGIVEILRPDGTACDVGEVGEVVATCLTRSYQPLIRFRLGDLAAWDGEPCLCGRSMPVIKEVVGRLEDVVIGLDGRQLVRFHGIFTQQPHVVEGQIIQETLQNFTVRVVPAAGFSAADEADIRTRMVQRLGPDVNIRIERVDSIARSSSGKFKAVISRVK